jgi:hypothetical protein
VDASYYQIKIKEQQGYSKHRWQQQVLRIEAWNIHHCFNQEGKCQEE